MKQLVIAVLMILVIFALGCKNPFSSEELHPNADGIYVFHPEDMPQIQFKYDMSRWEMTVVNRASLTVKITIRRHEDESRGVSFQLRGFQSYSYIEMYEKGKRIRITINRDGITTNFTARLG